MQRKKIYVICVYTECDAEVTEGATCNRKEDSEFRVAESREEGGKASDGVGSNDGRSREETRSSSVNRSIGCVLGPLNTCSSSGSARNTLLAAP